MSIQTPAAEWPIDADLVRGLLREQHPDLAEEEIRFVEHGWDNAIYRLGKKFAVRLPRRALAASLIENEHRWLPGLAERLPIPIPSPIRLGLPSRNYPWPWSVLPWIPGNPANIEPPSGTEAERLAEFLRILHQPAPPSAPKNPYRGGPLCQREESMAERFQRLKKVSDIITPEVSEVWKEALAAPEENQWCWLHGDLHARNVLVEARVITGIIDWGDLTAGDAATDLAGVWSLFREPKARAECLRHYSPAPALLARAKGWAVVFGTVLFESGRIDSSQHAMMGKAILQRINEDG